MNVQRVDLTSQEFKRNPFPEFARLRAVGPLVRVKLPFIGKSWLATTYQAVDQILHDQQNFALEARHAGKRQTAGIRWWMPRVLRVLTKNMLTMDEPDHRRLRSLVEQAFLRQSVENMRGQIDSLADRFLDQVEQESSRNGGRVDLIRHFARPFPLAVICELLGLPEEDRPKFGRWAERLTTVTSVWGLASAMSGIRNLLRYLKQQFEVCRKQPRPGLITALVQAEQDGKRLSEDELLAMAFLLLFAGHETTVHLISGGILALLEHGEQKAELMSDWSQVGRAVEELLRFVSPVQMTKPRYATHDMELFGQTVRRGEFVLALLASANCDPAEFDEPERLDLQRHPNHHLAFGSGIHICLGLKLARAEAATAFEKLFTRFPDLALGVAPAELRWIERIGMRALASMPVALNGRGPADHRSNQTPSDLRV